MKVRIPCLYYYHGLLLDVININDAQNVNITITRFKDEPSIEILLLWLGFAGWEIKYAPK